MENSRGLLCMKKRNSYKHCIDGECMHLLSYFLCERKSLNRILLRIHNHHHFLLTYVILKGLPVNLFSPLYFSQTLLSCTLCQTQSTVSSSPISTILLLIFSLSLISICFMQNNWFRELFIHILHISQLMQ